MAASLWAKDVDHKVPQPEGILPWVPVPSFIEVLRAPRPWAVSSLALPGSSTLWTGSISFFCFNHIVSWADLEMVTWIWHKVKANSITLGDPTGLSMPSFIQACANHYSGNKQSDKAVLPGRFHGVGRPGDKEEAGRPLPPLMSGTACQQEMGGQRATGFCLGRGPRGLTEEPKSRQRHP